MRAFKIERAAFVLLFFLLVTIATLVPVDTDTWWNRHVGELEFDGNDRHRPRQAFPSRRSIGRRSAFAAASPCAGYIAWTISRRRSADTSALIVPGVRMLRLWIS